MSKLKRAIAVLGCTLFACGPAAAFGDMGKAPVVQGTYVSAEGGYFLLGDQNIAGFGLSASGTNFKNIFVSPEDGGFVGGMIGYASTEPLIPGLWFKRIEGYALFERADDSASAQSSPSGAISLTSVDASAIIAAGNSRGRAGASRDIAEGGLRFERDTIYDPTWSITWVLSPFVRNSDEDAFGACNCARRTGDVNTWMYGVVFDAEPEKWISPSVAIVGRLGAGLYGFNADGSFNSRGLVFGSGPDPLAAHVSDSDSGVGFRGQLGAGLKFKVWRTGMLETFAEADYFSDVGSVFLPVNTLSASAPARVNNDDLWELRTGARLTFALGGTPQP
jgi:hypothetical protein